MASPGDGENAAREGYYPDPSIPGYVRYWNGAAWVPGTSRPAPAGGASAGPPRPAAPAHEETGPVFLDEEPEQASASPSGPDDLHGSRPEPASAWQADTSRQTGFGGDLDSRVSWGAPAQDPRSPAAPAGEADPSGGALPGMRAPGGASARTSRTDGTMSIRATAPATGTPPRPGPAQQQQQQQHAVPAQAQAQPQAPVQPQPVAPAPQQPVPPQQAAAPEPAPAPAPATPLSSGQGGGAASWPQQVHQLARSAEAEQQPVTPWKPPVSDPFQRMAAAQAAARPAGLGKRLAARLIDSVMLGAVVGAVAVPLLTRAVEHIDDKVDAAKLSGETVTVWLIDGTTAGYLGIVLGALLVFGVLYEALPTAKWGRTLGKKVCGVQVRDIESHEPPSFGAALRRWLVYGLLGALAIGVVNVLWCLVDRPWRQCWHDKAARTFVAG
ncbi:RDD family protein [Streptomyces sp. A3M-1-3]|uniref:RDD family protein n=1 Tax=Streptomyces sp. A3M-1-3 TaxID=2962044 RepID=UPI0020B749FE|nr:RDD family protein [Streptomyces sp. A3M-1-3]MCP3819451.1 RDD family protein [Streptomyces sp. A3M-1-3]